ncbi:hypothetical protein DERP_013000 [Dermatophagoides pteronyssinus]|uniref:Uncharacterized protein n=1 Tax=Dermatophagoides pteronyssinus TaxID=6956 RepID=A0ABQ8ISM3_DERPT|nr:hypothetical protein DERP_013000 [Dermatophagoides pteronyssinus]
MICVKKERKKKLLSTPLIRVPQNSCFPIRCYLFYLLVGGFFIDGGGGGGEEEKLGTLHNELNDDGNY